MPRREEQRKVFKISKRLEHVALDKLRAVSDQLNVELGTLQMGYDSSVEGSEEFNASWFSRQIINVAKPLGYFADARTYAAWIKLKIREERRAEIVISFHSLGVDFLGVMAVSAFIEFRDVGEHGGTSVDGPYPLAKEVFQFAFNEDADVVLARFATWLSGAALAGLDQWRRQI